MPRPWNRSESGRPAPGSLISGRAGGRIPASIPIFGARRREPSPRPGPASVKIRPIGREVRSKESGLARVLGNPFRNRAGLAAVRVPGLSLVRNFKPLFGPALGPGEKKEPGRASRFGRRSSEVSGLHLAPAGEPQGRNLTGRFLCAWKSRYCRYCRYLIVIGCKE
jgi:hypothetical protein